MDMRRIGMGLWAGLWLWPCLASAQDPSMFGYCYVQVGDETLVSPLFEHPNARGLGKFVKQDQDGFREAVQTEVSVPQDTQVYCSYSAQRDALDPMEAGTRADKEAAKGSRKWRTIAWAPPPPPPKVSGPLVAEVVPAALQSVLAADPYFTVPKGKGGEIERADERIIGSGTDAGTLTQRTQAQQEGNVCLMSQDLGVRAGALAYAIEARGRSWAGLVPLATLSRTTTSSVTGYSRQQVFSLRHEGDALFPLRQGARTVLTTESQVQDDAEEAVSRDLRFECEVGASMPASNLVATATGQATELRCRTSMPSAPKAPAKDVIYHWFADVGCFVNAPIVP